MPEILAWADTALRLIIQYIGQFFGVDDIVPRWLWTLIMPGLGFVANAQRTRRGVSKMHSKARAGVVRLSMAVKRV